VLLCHPVAKTLVIFVQLFSKKFRAIYDQRIPTSQTYHSMTAFCGAPRDKSTKDRMSTLYAVGCDFDNVFVRHFVSSVPRGPSQNVHVVGSNLHTLF